MSHPTYRLALPSGGVVRVRKPHPILLLGLGASALPLLSAAIDAAKVQDEPEATRRGVDPYERVRAVNRLALLGCEIEPERLPFPDQLALYSWATAPGVDGGYLDEPVPWSAADLLGLVKGHVALLIDAVCRRYSLRPSECLGLDDATLAVDFDLAIGYRSLRHEGSAGKDELVEVDDAWGNTIQVPRSWLPELPEDAKMMRVEWYADHSPTGVETLSVGGIGPGARGYIAPMRH